MRETWLVTPGGCIAASSGSTDARTALVSGDLQLTAFGPQDISLALASGAKSLVGVAGTGTGNDCLLVRKGEDVKDWNALSDKRIGVGGLQNDKVTEYRRAHFRAAT